MAIKVSKTKEIKLMSISDIYNNQTEQAPSRPSNFDNLNFRNDGLTWVQYQLVKAKSNIDTPDEEDILKTDNIKEVRPYLETFLSKYDLEMDTPSTPLVVLIAVVDAPSRANKSYNQIDFCYAVLTPTKIERTLSDRQKGYLKEIESILIKYKVHLSDTDYELAIKDWYNEVTIGIKAYGDGWDKTPEEFFKPSDLKKLESLNNKLKVRITGIYAD